MTRIWFNHWFSTSYGIIELLKKNKDFYIIASNKQYESVIQKVCDEWYQDSTKDGEEYISYCVDFCKEHNIDVFVPRRKMVEISQNILRFEAVGTKVLVDDYSVLKLLNDKAATYEFLRSLDTINVPEYYIVNSVQEFTEAYFKLKQKHDQVCVKFVKDEGAMSYRRIVNCDSSFNRLRVYAGAEISYERYTDALIEKEHFDDLMVMPYLSGTEVSVDCLNTSHGLIAVPRFKSSARHEYVRYDENILNMTRDIMNKVNLKYPCNIQFKYDGDIPYLLEINTRMSGGLQMTCLAAEVNIPVIAVNKLTGTEDSWSLNKREVVVSYIETPEIIR